jgi:hypothetical protein
MSKRQRDADIETEEGPAKKARFELDSKSPFASLNNSGRFEFDSKALFASFGENKASGIPRFGGVPPSLPQLSSVSSNSFDSKALFASFKNPDVIVTETRQNFVLNPNFFLVAKTAKFGLEKEKLILHSGVWASHLKEDTKSTEIDLVGFRDDIIDAVCKFMYTPAWSGPFQPKALTYYQEMVPLAHKYEMKSLLDFCEQNLCKIRPLTPQDLRFAETYHLKALQAATIQEVAKAATLDVTQLKDCSSASLLRLIAEQHCVRHQDMNYLTNLTFKPVDARYNWMEQALVQIREHIKKVYPDQILQILRA